MGFFMRERRMRVAAVILAAGEGTRMKSKVPKVLHRVAGTPMIVHAINVARSVSTGKPVVVVGVGADEVQGEVGAQACDYVVQDEQLGTGHAVLQARQRLASQSDAVVVTYADMPLLRPETLQRLVDRHRQTAPAFTMLTVMRDDPRGFGRVLRDGSGAVQAVVEEADASPEQLSIRELNAGVYCFDAEWLWTHLDQIPLSAKGEYYLTDMVGIAVTEGSTVESLTTDDPAELLGVNTRVHLAEAEAAFRKRINERWMLDGVTIMDPATTYIEAGVEVGRDTVIYPNTHLQGQTSIGAASQVGPNTIIRDSVLGERCKVLASVIEGSTLEDRVDIGPFARLRPGAYLAEGVHMGNFGEVKNSYLGPGTKMGHFSYLGDTTTGANVNIGAGAITCNYDGQRKHRTEIDAGAFIGSDTMLVAPVRIGEDASTGAGSVVTRDVPAGSLAYGVPARVQRSEGQSAEEARKADPTDESKGKE
jgi:bifunctional UDP-N-acetylglucosamine pyrophosphorylase/glucosamine-1-phosphate N-acetyltransferase